MTIGEHHRIARAKPGLSAAGIAATYFIVSVVWILASDVVLSGLFPSFSGFFLGEVLKGIAFITATAMILFVLIRRGHIRIREIERHARDELRFQEDVLAQVSDAVAFAALDGRLLYANSSALRLYGVEPGHTSEILGRPFAEVVDFQWTQEGDDERCREAFERKGRWRGEIILRTRYGKQFVLDCDITRVHDDHGKTSGALVIARDVTEHRRAERRLRRSEERLALHMELIPLAAVEWDENMVVTRWNDAAEQIFGYPKQKMIGGAGWEMLVPESDRPKVREVIHRLLEKGEPVQVINRNCRKDGTEIICEWFNTPLVGEDGSPIGVASLVADITQRRLDQQRLQESLHVQRLLLSELDHRVKNALAGLITMIDLTRSRADTIDRFALAVRGRVEAMARVHAMLSQSRWTSLDLREIIEAMRPPESSGRVHLEGPGVLIPVRQATPLGMAVQELMSNSLKHGALSAPWGNLSVRWRTSAHADAHRRELLIDWQESGGPAITTPPEPGLGTSLIEGFCRFELGGEVELGFPPGGARHALRLVLDDADPENCGVSGLRPDQMGPTGVSVPPTGLGTEFRPG